MKARPFAEQLRIAGFTLGVTLGQGEPDVVAREGPAGPERPVKAVKIQSGKIIIEF